MIHKLSIDYEEWFHSFHLRKSYPINTWCKEISRIEKQTDMLLNILKSSETKATFFIVGWIADNFPHLIEKIIDNGNEIGIHSYWHTPIFQQSPDEFKLDIEKSQNSIYKISNFSPQIYRAPNFSIRKDNLWCLPILKYFGINYDSSVHNVKYHPDYGEKHKFSLEEFKKVGIEEFPISVLNYSNINIPFAGGAYFRYYPYFIIDSIFKQFENKNEQVLFYIHPWELDKDLPNFNVSYMTKLRLSYNIKENIEKFERLLSSYKFEPILQNQDINQ